MQSKPAPLCTRTKTFPAPLTALVIMIDSVVWSTGRCQHWTTCVHCRNPRPEVTGLITLCSPECHQCQPFPSHSADIPGPGLLPLLLTVYSECYQCQPYQPLNSRPEVTAIITHCFSECYQCQPCQPLNSRPEATAIINHCSPEYYQCQPCQPLNPRPEATATMTHCSPEYYQCQPCPSLIPDPRLLPLWLTALLSAANAGQPCP